MKIDTISVIGLLLLLAGAGGVYLLFAQGPAHSTEDDAPVETVVPVRVGTIQSRTLHGYEVVYGRIEAAPPGASGPGAYLSLRTPVDGVLTRIACGPGQQVEPNQVLFELDTRLARAALQQRQQTLDFARREYERQQQLLVAGGTSEQTLQQTARDLHLAEQALGAAQVTLDYHRVRAPIAGTITSIAVTRGMTVQATQRLGALLDPRRQVLSLQIPGAAQDRVQCQQGVELAVEQPVGGVTWVPAGPVDYLAPQVDPRSGTRHARVALEPDSGWRIGQFVQARIVYDTHAQCLAVPASALVTNPQGETTIAVIGNGRARQVPVHAGLREDPWIEVTGDGLAPGMRIATEGAYGLPDETQVSLTGGD